jgi:hypothetical protein
MRERPILFSAPMVRATLPGIKTQTRRALAIQPHEEVGALTVGMYHPTVVDRHGDEQPGPEVFGVYSSCGEFGLKCPYGQAGDRLWGRENGWERPERTPAMMREGADTWAPYYYDADGISESEAADLKRWGFKRRPSIHMPRKACRILLEVTGIRVERLQDITEADAIAEGVERAITGDGWRWYADPASELAGLPPRASAVDSYRTLWEHLGGPGSWAINPWVWVVEFRRAA